MTAIRELHEIWRCEGCKFIVQAVTLPSGNIFYGVCLCEGWTEQDLPWLSRLLQEIVAEGLAKPS